MKKAICILFGITLLNLHAVIAQEFTTEMKTIYTSTNESARLQHIKSALDTKGNIHIVFTGYENHPYYGTNKSGAWKFKKLEYLDTDYNETYDVAYYPNIAIDKSNNVNIVMLDKYKEKILYAKKTPSTNEWEFTTVKVSPEPLRFLVYGDYTDMAIDENGGLHFICMADYTSQNEHKSNMSAIYLNKSANSEKWQLQILVQTNEEQFNNNWFFGNNSTIACYKDKVYAAIGGSNELHFGTRKISGGFWDIEKLIQTPDEFINSEKDMLSLALAPNGSVKFAFFDQTDDEKSPYNGLTIFSQSSCGNDDWKGFNGLSEPLSKNRPAMAIDNNGKTYIAIGRNEFTLFHQACDCDNEYERIFSDNQNSADFVDMLIDKQNVVHTFFTSNNYNNLYHLTAKPNSSTEKCNYPPTITNYTGKTNVAPGEEWTATIAASDPECDKVNFYTITKPDYFMVNDHGNGTAIIKARMPEGDGFGDSGLTVFVRDDKHENIDNKVSSITFKLRLTQEGKEKGSINVENKCTGNANK